ncbi:MAG: hypothetical protein KAS32_00880, partial [Candidatus Peribacteraceae bacterium]|nr:hypothetical protein [Candidatus Peribacteraceae bacterium]
MKLHKFTHGDTQQPVYLAESLIFAWYKLGPKTIIVANGGASIPVKEELTYVTNKIEGVTDGTDKRSDDNLPVNN